MRSILAAYSVRTSTKASWGLDFFSRMIEFSPCIYSIWIGTLVLIYHAEMVSTYHFYYLGLLGLVARIQDSTCSIAINTPFKNEEQTCIAPEAFIVSLFCSVFKCMSRK